MQRFTSVQTVVFWGIVATAFALHGGILIGLQWSGADLPRDPRGIWHLSRACDVALILLVAAITYFGIAAYEHRSRLHFAISLALGSGAGWMAGMTIDADESHSLWMPVAFSLAIGVLYARAARHAKGGGIDSLVFLLAFALVAGVIAGIWTAGTILLTALAAALVGRAAEYAVDRFNRPVVTPGSTAP